MESNARLTGTLAAVLLVLLAAEGLTILQVHRFLDLHIFLGMLLVPPVALKIGSVSWRFARYYSGSPQYRHKGPPPVILRVLGPAVVALTVLVFASGILLIVTSGSTRSQLLFVHKASFVVWFGAMTIHVIGHLGDTARLVRLDAVARTRRQVANAGARTWAIMVSVVAGIVIGAATWGHSGTFGHIGH